MRMRSLLLVTVAISSAQLAVLVDAGELPAACIPVTVVNCLAFSPPEKEKEPMEDETGPVAKLLPSGHTADTLDTVRKRRSNNQAVLVDVREKDEWEWGHLKGAVFIPLSYLRAQAGKPGFAEELAKVLPKDRILYCHCHAGGRVLAAAPILKKLGYDARPLKAGYADLVKAGFEKAK